ncbi:MAG: hypothetical protein ACI9U2_004653 [Bradymonadia bacterium]|jgi:hypothetical protein
MRSIGLQVAQATLPKRHIGARREQRMCEVVLKKTNETQTTTTVVTETLTAFEERVLRMRTGAALAPGEALGNKLDNVRPQVRADVEARLLLMEAQLLADIAPDRMAEPVQSPRKTRIIDALAALDED